ncbi:MAG: phosphatidylinositol-specific phospholipase C1-like protein [Janthinobacterium lividum]
MCLRAFAKVVAVLLISSVVMAQSSSTQDKLLHVNQIQVIGTHNSYNLGFAASEAKYFQQHFPKAYPGLEYHHQNLELQLSSGIRQLELDLVADPEGHRFAHPKIVELTRLQGLPPDPDFDPDHEMDKPGFKVIHLGDLNQRSSCLRFVQCLQNIRRWSESHPRHVPLFILIEDKQGKISQLPDAMEAQAWTAETWDALDREILSVFPRKQIVTPDDVRGHSESLEQAVLTRGWPSLAKTRGKVIFLLYNRKSAPGYLAGHPSLRGRLLFTNGTPGQPDAAFVELDNGTPAAIQKLVRTGYLVRTRADFNTDAARRNDTTRSEQMLESGAQIISTDFPLSEPAPWTGYTVALPAGLPARCNPVNAPAGCDNRQLENASK